MFCYRPRGQLESIWNLFTTTLIAVACIGVFNFLLTSACDSKTASAKVEDIQLPSGDMICKRYRTGFTKCEDSIAVCYYDRNDSSGVMNCLKKDPLKGQ